MGRSPLHTRAPDHRFSVVFLLVGVALLVGAGVWYFNLRHPSASATPKPVNFGQVPVVPPTTTAPGKKPQLGINPVSVSIPSLGIQSVVVPVAVSEGGVLGVPSNPQTVGWWSAGPKPGAAVGTAVLTSHVNWDGVAGAFAQLYHVQAGADVIVESATGSESFVITGVREYRKTALPAQAVFSQAVAGRLVLVTCGGPFDAATGHYDDNIVAYAVPAAA